MDHDHIHFMHMALEQAAEAGRRQEVPVGAVLVSDTGSILARRIIRWKPLGIRQPTPKFWPCVRAPVRS